jgi:hypothetical protein
MSDNNIVKLVSNDADADEILEDSKGKYKEVFVLGWGEDDYLTGRGSKTLDNRELLFMLEIFKNTLLNAAYEDI